MLDRVGWTEQSIRFGLKEPLIHQDSNTDMIKLVRPALLAILLVFSACSSKKSDAPATADTESAVDASNVEASTADSSSLEWVSLPDGLEIADMVVGEGPEAEAGMNLQMHYTGWLYDENAPEGKGTKFDSSRDRGQTFDVPLGKGMVIKGWDEGIVGMKPGGRRMLKIPSNLGYGPNGRGPIPGGATMLFDVALISIRAQ